MCSIFVRFGFDFNPTYIMPTLCDKPYLDLSYLAYVYISLREYWSK